MFRIFSLVSALLDHTGRVVEGEGIRAVVSLHFCEREGLFLLKLCWVPLKEHSVHTEANEVN